MSADVQRTEIGHWPAGTSGNPGGYSKEKRAAIARLTELARMHTEDALKTVVGIMLDEKLPPTTRLTAAGMLWDRGHGKPAQSVGVSFADPQTLPVQQAGDVELARWIANKLMNAAESLDKKQLERATATDAELIGATNE